MSAFKIVRVSHEEDAFAADETKVHTLSRQAITELLDTAAREEVSSSAPPPPESGIRTPKATTGTERPLPAKSGMVPAFPRPAALPVMWEDDEEGLEPTRLSERASHARQQLVTQLMNEPPRIICREESPADPPDALPEIVIPEDIRVVVAPAPSTGIERVDRRALAITLATFLATLVPALVLLHHLLAR
jgi:hypothetical protein